MSSNPEEPNAAKSPSELALAEFLKRVEADTDLSEEIKAAVAKDLKGQSPAALANLRAALAPKDGSSAA